jgi:hypothetical protein
MYNMLQTSGTTETCPPTTESGFGLFRIVRLRIAKAPRLWLNSPTASAARDTTIRRAEHKENHDD